MKSNRLRRISSRILIFVALVTVTVLIIRPLQKELFAKMTALRDELIAQGEAFLGMRIEYASLGPSLFSTLDIRGLRIYGSASEPLVSLARLRISFSLLGILQGKGLDALSLIQLDKPVVSLDFDHAGDWEALLAKTKRKEADVPSPAPDENSGNWLAGLPGNISLNIRGGEGNIYVGKNRFSLSGVNLDSVIRENRVTIKGKAEGGAFLNDFLGRSMSMGMNCRFNGEVDTRLQEGKLALAVPSFAGEGFSLKTLQFDITLDPEKVELQKAGDRFSKGIGSFEISLGYAFKAQRFFGRFEGRDFTPRRFLSLSGPWKEYNPILALNFNGTASFDAGFQSGVSYALDLSGNLGALFPIKGVSYAVTAAGNGESVYFRRLLLKFPQGDIQYAGSLNFKTLSPNGTIFIRDFSLAADSDSLNTADDLGGYLINADLTVNSYGRTITIFGDNVSMGSVFLTSLDADVRLEDKGLSFDFSALRLFTGEESSDAVRISSLSVKGSLDYEPRHLQASLLLDMFSLADVLSILRPLAIIPALPEPASLITAGASITTEIFVTTNFDQILYNAPRFVLVYQEGQSEVVALASISGTNKRFDLSESRIVMGGNAAEASGYLDFSNFNDIFFSLTASYQDISYYLNGNILDQRSLSVQGSYGLSVYINRTPEGGYSGYAEANFIPVPFQKQLLRVAFLSSLKYDATNSWSVDLTRLEIRDLVTPASSSASLVLAGKVNQSNMTFREILFDDGKGKLFGWATLSWSKNTETDRDAAGEKPALPLFTLHLRLRDELGNEAYNIDGNYDKGLVEVRLTGQEMQVGRVSNAIPHAVAAGEAQLHWEQGRAYKLTVVLSSLTAKYNEIPITLSAQGALTEEEIAVRNFQVSYGDLEVELPLFRINRQDSEVWVQGQLGGSVLGRRLDGSFTAEAEFAPFETWISLGKALDSFSGSVNVARIRLDTLDLAEPFRIEFSRNESLISLTGGPRNMVRFRITNEGAFYAGISYPSPIRGAVTGTIASNTIDASASNLYVDLTALGRLLPYKDVVTLTGGLLNGSVDIRGPLGDPEFFGIAQGNSVRLEIPQFLGAELGPVPVMVTLEGNEMRFGPIDVPAGEGYGVASGWFRFDRWIPSTFSIDINAPSEYPVPFDFEILGIIAQGNASGSMNISIEDSRLRLSGDLLAEDTEIILDTQGISAAMDQADPGGMGIITDFTLTTGKKVEFFWPNAAYPLLQASAMAGRVIKISSDSETSRFSIKGDIDLMSGYLYYGQRNFYIRQGTLFFNENEVQFDPRIMVRAETRDRTNDGPVTISMIVDTAPLMTFTARFESNPPLSQVEIMSLMGQTLTGLPAEGGEGPRVQNLVFSGIDFWSQSFLFRRLERMIRRFIGLDMFTFHSPIVQNFFTSQWNPVDNRGLGNYFDNTAVFFGKYFSPDMFFQGSILLQYDVNKVEMMGFTFETDLGMELHSPLFDIRWSIDPLKYQTFFDASFTLTWRWLL
jgi:hypothetical protein